MAKSSGFSREIAAYYEEFALKYHFFAISYQFPRVIIEINPSKR